MHNEPPAVLDGRYELGDLLGRGGMSDVYRAHDRAEGRDVAIKLFRTGLDIDGGAARRQREARLALTLRHPGLVRLLAARTDRDGGGYLVMELVEGETLGKSIRRAPWDEAAVVELGARLCAALAYVHERGVVHRDVKPANVLLAEDGTPKLADFGIARVLDSTRMTVDGFTIGTANYLSPEQVTGQEVGYSSDVYSLGLVLVEALTGELAFPGHGVEAALARLHRDPVVPATVSPALRALLTEMTDRQARRRPTSVQARDRFERLQAQPTVALRTTVLRTPRRAAMTLGGLGAAAAAVLAGVLWLGAGGSSGSTPRFVPASTSPAAAHRLPSSPAGSATPARVVTRTSPSHRATVVPVADQQNGAALQAALPHTHAPAGPVRHGPGRKAPKPPKQPKPGKHRKP